MLPGFVCNLNFGRQLPAPAATAAAVTAAIAAVSAATTAATPTTTAARPSTTTAAWSSAAATTARSPAATTTAVAATTTARSASPATAATLTRGARFVDDDVAAHEIVAVQSLYGAVGFFVAIDLDKSEPARLPRETVAHQRDICRGDSRLRK
jgi:hypothetical protein